MTTLDRSYSGSAAAKVLLFGEHAVVYGEPAIATGIPDGASAVVTTATAVSELSVESFDATFRRTDELPLARAFDALLTALEIDEPVQVDLTLNVPAGVGLGSSAAMGIATARALAARGGHQLSRNDLDQLGFTWEGVFHGTPSGIDHTAAAIGGLFVFIRKDGQSHIETLRVSGSATLIVGLTGPARSTREMVASVREQVESSVEARSIVSEIGALVRQAQKALEAGDWQRVGQLMNQNHEALSRWNLSTPGLDAAVQAAQQAGALGAKLTGGGGGGCMIALADDESAQTVASALNEHCQEVVCRPIP